MAQPVSFFVGLESSLLLGELSIPVTKLEKLRKANSATAHARAVTRGMGCVMQCREGVDVGP